MFETTPKMPAKNHFPDIIGINLEYTLDTYDWEGWNPMTDNGITVSGFWDKSKDPHPGGMAGRFRRASGAGGD